MSIDKISAKKVNEYFGSCRLINTLLARPEEWYGIEVMIPKKIQEAFGTVIRQYQDAFMSVMRNVDPPEYETLLRLNAPGGLMFQVDMKPFDRTFVEWALRHSTSIGDIARYISRSIYEIENSLAMYELMRSLFTNDQGKYINNPNVPTFSNEMDRVLDAVRQTTKKRIALVATDNEKAAAMLESEFGIEVPKQYVIKDGKRVPVKYDISDEELSVLAKQQLNPNTVRQRTGFDTFFTPYDIVQYAHECGDPSRSEYVFYVRSSVPPSKLRKPKSEFIDRTLSDETTFKFLRALSITPNIDKPGSAWEDHLNDTKRYMIEMGIGYHLRSLNDILTEEYLNAIRKGKADKYLGNKLTPDFKSFLESWGKDVVRNVEGGSLYLRFKPIGETYGAYGHVKWRIGESVKKLKETLKIYESVGGLVSQLEMEPPTIPHPIHGDVLTIYRIFFAQYPDGNIRMMGGFVNSVYGREKEKGNVHGGKNALWSPIIPEI